MVGGWFAFHQEQRDPGGGVSLMRRVRIERAIGLDRLATWKEVCDAMSLASQSAFELVGGCEDSLDMKVASANRRSAPRAKLSLTIRIRSSNSKYAGEICTTSNMSRDGLYFVTSAGLYLVHYFRNMKLHVVRNFQPNDPANREEIGEVVRVDGPKDGKWGVAIRIATSTKFAGRSGA
jgi:hypothetical protein